MTILIIEDDTGICNLLQEFLNEEGYNTVCADTGTKALELLSQQKFSLITLDISLPDMTGNDILRELSKGRLAAAYAQVPVIVISANPNLLVENPEVGAVLAKPFNIFELASKIEELV